MNSAHNWRTACQAGNCVQRCVQRVVQCVVQQCCVDSYLDEGPCRHPAVRRDREEVQIVVQIVFLPSNLKAELITVKF